MMAKQRSSRTVQTDGNRIFFAERAAERLLARTSAEHGAVMNMSRDELAALAQQMLAVAQIAKRHHLERATAGSLAPEAHPGPADA